MSTIQVKPHPDLPAAAAKVIKHPVSGGLLDAVGAVPPEGRPWLYDGVTCRFLTDKVILRADDHAFAVEGAPPAEPTPAESTVQPTIEPDPAH